MHQERMAGAQQEGSKLAERSTNITRLKPLLDASSAPPTCILQPELQPQALTAKE